MRKTSILFFLCIAFSICNAQNISIKGRVVEYSNKELTPFPFANIALLLEDSTVVTGTTSLDNGEFSIGNINKGDYIIKASFIGYNNVFLKIENLQQSINVGDMLIQQHPLELDEVVVTASNIIQHIDRKVIFPAKDELKRSSNTYDLLSRMMISRLQVDPVERSMAVSGGGSVQTRVNGIQVSREEFMAIEQASILRIEYIEDPGSRYNDNSLGAIINIITKRRESGGLISVSAGNSPHVIWGENFLVGKYNYKKSEWGLTVNNYNRGFDKTRKDFTETFHLQNGETIKRTQEGINATAEFFTNQINLSYNLYEADKYTLNVIFYNRLLKQPHGDAYAKQYETGNSTDFIYSKTRRTSSSYTPSLDIYYRYTLPYKQSIEFNLVGTMIDTENYRLFREYTPDNVDLTSFTNQTSGKKYSVIAEGIYDKEFDHIKISAGARHFQMRAKNKYTGSNPVNSQMNQAESYGFAELQGKAGTFNYAAGVGVTRSWFKEGRKDNTKYTFSPMARLSYSPDPSLFLRYNFSIAPSIPGLGSLSDVEQAQDTIQIIRGNPMLKTYQMIKNNLNISFSKGVFNTDLNVRYDYYNKPIMESIFSENNKMIFMDDNQRSFRKLNIEGHFALKGVDVGNLQKFISANLNVGYSKSKSKGNTYEHSYDNFYMTITAYLNYKTLSLMGQYRKDQSHLFGETIRKGETTNFVGLIYTKDNLNAGIYMMCPFFNNYKVGTKRLSKIAPHEVEAYVDDIKQMVFFRLAYTFNFGRKYKSEEKRIKNSDSDSGIINL